MHDTTGAGDTFNGVLAGAVARGWALDRATHWATLAAAHSVTKSGARGGMPTASEIEALDSRINSGYGEKNVGSRDRH